MGLASVSLKRKAENAELLNSIEGREKTSKKRVEQVSRNDQSDLVSKGPLKKKERSELAETSAESNLRCIKILPTLVWSGQCRISQNCPRVLVSRRC